MHPSFGRIDHRPWPLPPGRWTWRQTWCDLLFAHWPIPAEALRPLIPAEFEIVRYEGEAWLGVVPFRMEGVMRRPLPDLPWISAFPELNLRTYVRHAGRPGVWFLSLDAARALAVWAARRFFDLPYHHADFEVCLESDGFDYSCLRRGWSPGQSFHARYRPTSPPRETRPGTLEHALTEQYRLFARSPRGRISCTEIHHQPWPIQDATAEIRLGGLLESQGLAVFGPPATLHFAKRLEVVVWSPEGCN